MRGPKVSCHSTESWPPGGLMRGRATVCLTCPSGTLPVALGIKQVHPQWPLLEGIVASLPLPAVMSPGCPGQHPSQKSRRAQGKLPSVPGAHAHSHLPSGPGSRPRCHECSPSPPQEGLGGTPLLATYSAWLRAAAHDAGLPSPLSMLLLTPGYSRHFDTQIPLPKWQQTQRGLMKLANPRTSTLPKMPPKYPE